MPILWYVHDPMCSWCWGFIPTWTRLQQRLEDNIEVRYLLGGLAPDSDLPMPDEMQINIRDTWRTIQRDIPGTDFNFDFWTTCQPRRSTWPSCRAVIAARQQNQSAEKHMIHAIQQAYYREARNPSDEETLVTLATQIGLDTARFRQDLNSRQAHRLLEAEIARSQQLGVEGFPSLVLENGSKTRIIELDYLHTSPMLEQVLAQSIA